MLDTLVGDDAQYKSQMLDFLQKNVKESDPAEPKKVKKKKEIQIDARGTLPDGAVFANYFEMRDQIAKQDGAFERGFAEALIEYGLGRPYGFSDESLRERILKRADAKNGEMREFIIALIQSKPFRTKK